MHLFRNNKELKEEIIPEKEFYLEEDGFIGSLFTGKKKTKDKSLIILGGTDGNYNFTKMLAQNFSGNGISSLALAYFNQPGLPDSFENNPIEYVELAVKTLKEAGYKKVGIWGISKGAELALITGSLLTELISCVIAVCPINIIPQGFKLKDGSKTVNASSWSFRGMELPWAPLKFSKFKVVVDSLKKRSISLRSCYLSAVLNSGEKDEIPVEKINGPILLIAPENDSMWPSEIASKKIKKRLEKKNFKFPFHFLSYKYASVYRSR